MYDYVDGKADWMAFGLPVEGEDGPFLAGRVEDVPTCDVRLTAADARRVLDGTGADVVVLVHGDGLAVGEVDADALDGSADDVPLLDLLRPVPTTVRPSVTVAAVAEGGGGTVLVTTADGRLVGGATVEGADHHHHAHEDQDDGGSGEATVDEGRYEEELAAVMGAVEERFGDREPSPEELQAFLRDRLMAEGRSAEEAEGVLREVRPDPGDDDA